MMVETYGGDEAAARAALDRRGYTVEGEEDGPSAGGDLAVAPGGGNLAALDSVLAGQRKSIGKLYDTITNNIKERYRAPDLNDLLVQIGVGMMSPPGENDAGGFGGALQRGLRGIGTYAQSRRDYENEMNKTMSQLDIQRATALAGLGEKYLGSAATALRPRGGTWSETMGQFISPDTPVPTQHTITTGGHTLIQYTDGTLRLQNADGSVSVYSPEGHKIRDILVGGAK